MSTTPLGRRSRLIVAGTITGLVCGGIPALGAAAAPGEPRTPKNVIVMISDGAGYNQFDAARLFETGESYRQVAVDPATGAVDRVPGTPSQVYDSYPVQVSQSHYSASGRAAYTTEDAWGDFDWVASGATDSAAAGTALGTGVKTNNGVLGHDASGERLLTVGEQAKEVGKKVGLVTSVTFNHATPAGFIAHNPDRNDYHGLATEMIDSGADVIIGAGHPEYTDANEKRAAHFGSGSWISESDFTRVSTGQTPFEYIEAAADFASVAAGEDVPDKLFGLARTAETFQYNRPGLDNDKATPFTDPLNEDVPSLATSAQAALNVLEKDDDGFFLMVEGGAVDWAGHANQTTRLVEEQVDFNSAVEQVDAWVEKNSSWDETLVVVTADHETGYLSGPGADPSWTPLTGEKGALPEVSWSSGGHTNALVPFFAKGAGSELLAARSDSWDVVRGAYLDNTDVGEVVFDILGHPDAAEDSVALEATVPSVTPGGELSLAVGGGGEPVAFHGGTTAQSATLPRVSVSDTRNEAQAQGKGWTVSGRASDFTAGNRSFGADRLSWLPQVVASDSGAAAGSRASLGAPSTLAEADRVTRVGTTVVGAALDLSIPEDARSGRYGSEVTLTLFPKD
ncbi:alkaline phosphatase [Mycetocola reblochoni]|uniref:Alkaline phosphatase n=2 Tax=Mycetocola reblochoni TaxID=331618 RepID=A0A1R4JAT8_9MICO|nr:alkaline phosphatase [Mycetocola reblochoni]RLP70187.1 alkaline phosphatase [Mycetocola reblochoni]SJN29142.1 Alkaline phosphatase [Mycetocola reblochoni REB411]